MSYLKVEFIQGIHILFNVVLQLSFEKSELIKKIHFKWLLFYMLGLVGFICFGNL
jgi:hypothetical protein